MIGPELLTVVLLTVLAVSFVFAFVRLLRGPSLPDRVVALDLISTAGVAVAGVYAIGTGRTVFLDVAVVIALIAFLGTVAFAHYIENLVERRDDR